MSSSNNNQIEGETERETKLTTRSCRRIRLIIVQLDIRVRQRLVETLHHGLDRDLLRERVGEDVPRGDLDRLLPQVVLQDDEARVELRGVAEDGFPVGEDLLGRGGRVEVEVYVNENGQQCYCAGDIGALPSVSKVAVGLRRVHMTGVKPRAMEMLRTRSLEEKKKISISILSILSPRVKHPLNITKRRPHHVRRNPKNVLNNLPRPPKLRNNLLVRQRRQARMTLRMDRNLMTLQMLALEDARELEAARPEGEEGRVEGLFGEKGKEVGGCRKRGHRRR
jgi:hypothetical protein